MALDWPRTRHIRGISGLRAEPTGAAICFNADVPAIAKVDHKAGSVLTVKVASPFMVGSDQLGSVQNYLPLGLANHVKLISRLKGISQLSMMMSRSIPILPPTGCAKKQLLCLAADLDTYI